ncbi:amidohydrolase 2 [hydrothermal vent metagenome]|uniref:Amidohydrolase 2 n=1 Tax=hydrothermal vent metagenome TaxID=652676 RepID=A0A3B0U260_9ZZZZ
MTKRRDFIKKSVLGLTAGIATGGMSLNAKPSTSVSIANGGVQKDWHKDPEWREIKYGGWGGPGVSPGPGPMDDILVKDYAPRSSVVTQETFVPKAKYQVIDSHVHVLARTPEEVADWVKTMDEVGIETSLVLTGVTGDEFDALVDSLPKAFPGRFQLYCGMDKTNIDKPDYSERVVAELERCYTKGAIGVGEITDKGYGIVSPKFDGNYDKPASLPRNKRLHPDDDRLDNFWGKCAELGMPVSLHVADHPSCWTPLDVYQERTPDYQHFNKYGLDVPSYAELIEKRNRTLKKHPNTIFISCHLGNQGHDLEALSHDMDKYPNLYLDTSARDYEMGRTPRTSAKFLEKYKGRILFGTDQSREKSMYQMHWRLLETADEYIVGRLGWRYYGLDLSDSVLKSMYYNTASKILNLVR